MRVATPLAYVRLADGGTVPLERGEPVPPGADPEHVELLAGKGVLVDEGVEILDDAGEPIELAPLPKAVESGSGDGATGDEVKDPDVVDQVEGPAATPSAPDAGAGSSTASTSAPTGTAPRSAAKATPRPPRGSTSS